MNAKTTNLMNHSVEELNAKAIDLDREIFTLRNTLAIHRKLEKPHLMKSKKREKARILTAFTQKQRSQGVV